MDADDDLPSAAEVERRFMEELRRINPVYPKTVGMNFRALARGGLSTDYLFLTCYVDYTVHEYILGSGPTGAETLSISYDQRGEARSYDLYRQAHGAGEFGDEEAMTEAEYADYRSQIAFSVEMVLSLVLEGRESVLFLAPMGAHQAIAVEAWQVVAQWDLRTDDGGTVNAVHYGVSEHNPESSQTFTNLEDRVDTAAEDDEFADERMENVDELDDYYEEIGAYDDITPDDGETTTFTPAQPPSVPSCANGTAVTDPSVNRALVHDCEVLLDNKDTLAGTASLDWAADSAITSWEGVTTGGTPSRVTELDLPSKSLTGSIPAELGTLFELTTLDLSGNSLTGEIPAELGLLENLVELSLSGNTLTGCIPVALEDVATNDLSTLGLLYCAPPAPESLSAGSPGEVSIPLTWDAVSNTSKYRVEYRLRGPNDWTTDDDTLTATTHTVDELVCESPYQFRVSAYGSGTTYAADWSEASGILSETTGTCVAPEFDAASYTFSVAEDAAIDDAVGTVSATDSPGDTVSYEITAGNDDDAFAINSDTGEIAVASGVDEHTASPTALTVEARDLSGGTTEATVDIYINRPPSSLIVTPSGDHRFSLTWSSVPGADYYTLHYKEKREGSYDEFILTSNTFKVLSTDDGCATPYEFWISTVMDGAKSSETGPVETSCNFAPEFGEDSYSFTVEETAGVGDAAGAIPAYDRTGGNADYWPVAAGQTLTLAEIAGPGCVRHVWMTTREDDDNLRRLVLRMYWDGEETPSVVSPVGDFFGLGHAAPAYSNSLPLQASYLGLNCWFPMPYSTSARIDVTNDSEQDTLLYFYIDYQQWDSPVDDMARFHAQWRRELVVPKAERTGPNALGRTQRLNTTGDDNYIVLDVEGKGHYVGCALHVDTDKPGWWGEGDDMFFVDGETWPPSIHGTGTEDYFCGAWNYNRLDRAYSTPYYGYHVKGNDDYTGKHSQYRFHIEDPIYFERSLRFSIEHGHANDKQGDWSSTAYWYQVNRTAPLPEVPPFDKRRPM